MKFSQSVIGYRLWKSATNIRSTVATIMRRKIYEFFNN